MKRTRAKRRGNEEEDDGEDEEAVESEEEKGRRRTRKRARKREKGKRKKRKSVPVASAQMFAELLSHFLLEFHLRDIISPSLARLARCSLHFLSLHSLHAYSPTICSLQRHFLIWVFFS